MIRAPHFSIGHLAKCAGDAVVAMLEPIAPPSWKITSLGAHAKHDPFTEKDLEKPRVVLSFRRLPAWMLSITNHLVIAGLYPQGPQARPTIEQMTNTSVPYGTEVFRTEYGESFSTIADHLLSRYSPHKINRWLRQETLIEDILQLAPELLERQLTPREKIKIGRAKTKTPFNYDHEIRSAFYEETIRKMYENNPLWREIEEMVYQESVDF